MRFRVQLLADLLLRISVSCIPAGLALRRGGLPVTAVISPRKSVDLLVGASHPWSFYRRLWKRAKDVITSCSRPYLRYHHPPISYVLCYSRAVPVIYPLPSTLLFKWCLAARAAVIKLLGVWLGLRAYAGVPERVARLT